MVIDSGKKWVTSIKTLILLCLQAPGYDRTTWQYSGKKHTLTRTHTQCFYTGIKHHLDMNSRWSAFSADAMIQRYKRRRMTSQFWHIYSGNSCNCLCAVWYKQSPHIHTPNRPQTHTHSNSIHAAVAGKEAAIQSSHCRNSCNLDMNKWADQWQVLRWAFVEIFVVILQLKNITANHIQDIIRCGYCTLTETTLCGFIC